MLTLTRSIDETITIGNDITCTVISIQGSQVKLGINAPRDVEVHREEIYFRIKAAKEKEVIN